MSGRMQRLSSDPLVRAIRLLDVRWRAVAKAIGLGSLALGSAVALTAVSAWLIARASQMPPVGQVSVATVAVRAFGTSRGVFRYLERLASHDVALRGMSALRTNLYSALATGRPQALMRVRRGDLLARVGTDVDAVGDLVVRALIPTGVAVVISAGSVVLVGAFLPMAGVALAVCLLVAGVLAPCLSARAARTVEARGASARSLMSATALEILESGGPLVVSGRMTAAVDTLRRADRDLAGVAVAGGRIGGLSAALNTGAMGLAVICSLVLGVPALATGSLAPVELAVIALTPLAAFEAAGALPAAAVQLRRSRESAERIMALVDDTRGPSMTQPPQPTTDEAPEADPPVETLVGADRAPDGTFEIELRDVDCGWGERAVLTNVSLTVTRGRAVALVGPSGIGKTTLLMTAAGLIPALRGEVLADQAPIADRASHDLARQVAFIAEDAHVFATSVLENLRVARGTTTPEEATAALTATGLGDWLAALPDGLDTELGQDATTISGGERRRLLIARALVAPAELLLIDEPAEHLDPATADALISHLVELTHAGQRGIAVATHRLTALDQMDEVILLGVGEQSGDPARVLARGTHSELLELPEYRWALEQEATV